MAGRERGEQPERARALRRRGKLARRQSRCAIELSPTTRERLDKTPTRLIVDYLAERVGGEEVAERLVQRVLDGEALPLETRAIAELFLKRFGFTGDACRFELEFDAEGNLRRVWRHERWGTLERFDPLPGSQSTR